jgi:hypothetical protein
MQLFDFRFSQLPAFFIFLRPLNITHFLNSLPFSSSVVIWIISIIENMVQHTYYVINIYTRL